MSQENVELVGRFHALRSGENLVPLIGEIVEQLGPDPQPDAILAFWAQDPSWRHVHPDIEWHASAAGEGRVARGAIEVAGWWREGIEVWESYVFRPLEYRDLGDWVLAAVEAQARGREASSLSCGSLSCTKSVAERSSRTCRLSRSGRPSKPWGWGSRRCRRRTWRSGGGA
jgi:hypothetical protein